MRTSIVIGALSMFCWLSSAAATPDDVIVYPAIATGAQATLEGRVIERKSRPASTQEDGRRRNLSRAMNLMINNERKFAPVNVRLGERTWQLTTDQEGYFRVDANLDALSPGRHKIEAKSANGEGEGELLIVPAANVVGVISDVDDTIMVTNVNRKRRMLANTFLLNPLQREAVPGIVQFYSQLLAENADPSLAPLIYLSASPRQLHSAIDAFLTHNGFPRGVLLTKRVTDDATSDPLTDQVAYKTGKLEALLAAMPQIKFTLIGDDGERDPEIYADIQKRYPDRIAAIWIRQVNPDPKRARLPGQGVLDIKLQEFLNR